MSSRCCASAFTVGTRVYHGDAHADAGGGGVGGRAVAAAAAAAAVGCCWHPSETFNTRSGDCVDALNTANMLNVSEVPGWKSRGERVCVYYAIIR